jgi:para-aminobenzoate synthetase/4-amino-4-deoxychorismate lyase
VLIDGAEPFVLLDDARPADCKPGPLYRNPVDRIEAFGLDEVRPALAALRQAGQAMVCTRPAFCPTRRTCAEPKLHALATDRQAGEAPLLWFGLFEAPEQRAADEVAALLPTPASAWHSPAEPLIDREAYLAAVDQAKEHIFAGNIYQANLTFAAELRFEGHPLALYARIRDRARAGHGGIVFTGEHWLLSFSPELFFTLSEGRLTTRPMKGTAVRRPDPQADAAAIQALRDDPKQRAENLMIVDLLRNDLSRVSRPGTVKVPRLFEIESYPTVHQMTSTVTSMLEQGLRPVDAIEALFPCGSITGAPKIRAIEIIAELEKRRRGVYTGSIGRVAPDGQASFNVAIRTLTARAGQETAVLGLGSGIVADSVAEDEWRECLAKGAFLESGTDFDLIETMRFDPAEGICALDRHLRRMKASADALGLPLRPARCAQRASGGDLRQPRGAGYCGCCFAERPGPVEAAARAGSNPGRAGRGGDRAPPRRTDDFRSALDERPRLLRRTAGARPSGRVRGASSATATDHYRRQAHPHLVRKRTDGPADTALVSRQPPGRAAPRLIDARRTPSSELAAAPRTNSTSATTSAA